MLFSQIAQILNIQPLQVSGDTDIQYLLTDSRKLILPNRTIFFALNSAHKNAHQYLGSLYHAGVRNFIVHQEEQLPVLPEANIIAVDNVLHALQMIAAAHRRLFKYPVIGITGSNGKTIVKEWLYQLLQEDFQVIRSPRSYNSQVGVPLSLWQMESQHNLAIIEAGISTTGEMANLREMINPDMGIITFLGTAHAEGFDSFEEKIEEKLLLFANAKALIYCRDEILLDKHVQEFLKKTNKNLKIFSWSEQHDSDVRAKVSILPKGQTNITVNYKEETFSFLIPFTDKASIHNALTCCSVLLFLGIPSREIAEKMGRIKPVEMRMELKQGINDCSVINDSYSADINSLNIALDFMAQLPNKSRRTLILSDLLEAGMTEDALYERISGIIAGRHLFRLIGIGPQITAHKALFSTAIETSFYPSTESFLEQFPAVHFYKETILLKGARSFGFEKISQLLEQKVHDTLLEINLNALRNNFILYRKRLPKAVKMMVMVKALSYGSGSFQVASVLQHAGADYLGVAYADEGVELRKAGIHLPIMVMNTEAAAFHSIINADLQPEIYSLHVLDLFCNYLDRQGIINYPVHIKLDTGMHRLGFLEDDIKMLLEKITSTNYIRIISVFSHLIASEDASQDAHTAKQFKVFTDLADEIENKIGYRFIRHIANTSAIHRHPKMLGGMVRLGIGLYGINSDPEMQKKLTNVTTLKTTVSQVKLAAAGETVGYGGKIKLDSAKKIAVVRIGYADGYPRAMGNGKGSMLIKDKLAPVIGNVCMDMTMLDVTGMDVKEDDTVIVFGQDLPVTHLAEWGSTISYEILTNISERVKRVYFEE